jgi:hypothetical protein
MSTLDLLWDEFLDKFERIPVWLPGTNMSLGDIGVIDNRGFVRLASLSDFDIKYTPEAAPARPNYYVASEDASTQDFGGSGSTSQAIGSVAAVEAGMRAKFSSVGAFVVRAENVLGTRIKDVLAVEKAIQAQNARNAFWEKRYIYVSEVVTAEPCIVLVSGSDTAEAKLGGSADLGPAGLASLAGASGHLRLTEQSGIDQYVVSPNRMPFMWRGRWQRGWFKKTFGDRGEESSPRQDSEDGEESSPRQDFEDFEEARLFDVEGTG